MEDLFERMKKIRPGSRITINGEEFPVERVAISRFKNQAWVNVATRDKAGSEVVVKAAQRGNELTLWRQISPAMGMAGAILFQQKGYLLTEEKITRVTGKPGEGTEARPVSRWVARLKSGLQMAVEIRGNGKYCFYFAEAIPPQILLA